MKLQEFIKQEIKRQLNEVSESEDDKTELIKNSLKKVGLGYSKNISKAEDVEDLYECELNGINGELFVSTLNKLEKLLNAEITLSITGSGDLYLNIYFK